MKDALWLRRVDLLIAYLPSPVGEIRTRVKQSVQFPGASSVYLSETRDMAAAKVFLRSAKSVTQVEPEQVTTDGHTSYPKAIADELGTDVDHRTSQYKNNVME